MYMYNVQYNCTFMQCMTFNRNFGFVTVFGVLYTVESRYERTFPLYAQTVPVAQLQLLANTWDRWWRFWDTRKICLNADNG